MKMMEDKHLKIKIQLMMTYLRQIIFNITEEQLKRVIFKIEDSELKPNPIDYNLLFYSLLTTTCPKN